MYPDIIAA